MRGAASLALLVALAAAAAGAAASPVPDAAGLLASITASFPAWWSAAEGDVGAGAPWSTGLLEEAEVRLHRALPVLKPAITRNKTVPDGPQGGPLGAASQSYLQQIESPENVRSAQLLEESVARLLTAQPLQGGGSLEAWLMAQLEAAQAADKRAVEAGPGEGGTGAA
jgi:hypothetical protein